MKLNVLLFERITLKILLFYRKHKKIHFPNKIKIIIFFTNLGHIHHGRTNLGRVTVNQSWQEHVFQIIFLNSEFCKNKNQVE